MMRGMDLGTAAFLFGAKAVNNKSTKVYYMVRGIKRKKSTVPPTEKQLIQRLKFRMASAFANEAKGAVDILYAGVRRKKWINQVNLATRYVLEHAVIGEYPDLQIDYSKALLTNGHSTGAVNTQFFVGADGVLRIEWDYPLMCGGNWDDEVVVFVYSDKFKRGRSYIGGARRRDLSVEVGLKGFRSGEVFHCWVFMAGRIGKEVSKSLYFRGEMR